MNKPCRTCKSVAVTESNPPCIVALTPQSIYFDGEPNGSISTIDPLLFFRECKLKNLQVSFSEVSKFLREFISEDSFASSKAFGLTSFAITSSTASISFATRKDLAPIPDNPSRKIFGY